MLGMLSNSATSRLPADADPLPILIRVVNEFANEAPCLSVHKEVEATGNTHSQKEEAVHSALHLFLLCVLAHMPTPELREWIACGAMAKHLTHAPLTLMGHLFKSGVPDSDPAFVEAGSVGLGSGLAENVIWASSSRELRRKLPVFVRPISVASLRQVLHELAVPLGVSQWELIKSNSDFSSPPPALPNKPTFFAAGESQAQAGVTPSILWTPQKSNSYGGDQTNALEEEGSHRQPASMALPSIVVALPSKAQGDKLVADRSSINLGSDKRGEGPLCVNANINGSKLIQSLRRGRQIEDDGSYGPEAADNIKTLGQAAKTVALDLYTKDSHFVMELVQNAGRDLLCSVLDGSSRARNIFATKLVCDLGR